MVISRDKEKKRIQKEIKSLTSTYPTQMHSALHIRGFHMHRFNRPWTKNSWGKKFQGSKKKTLTLSVSNYLHNIYIVLGIISNLDMI